MATQLPPELIQQVLSYVPQRDLWTFAQSSRACYDIALEAGPCIDVDVDWTNVGDRGFGDSQQTLDLLLVYISEHSSLSSGLNIALTARMFLSGNETLAAAAFHEPMQLLVPSIRRALPDLVRLELPFTDFTSLCNCPASKLRNLTVFHPGAGVPALIHSNLFAVIAPKLCAVSLELASTEHISAWQPVSVFARVTQLELIANDIPGLLAPASIAPAARVLVIEAPRAQGTKVIDLSGLSLRHVSFSGDTALLTAASAELLNDFPVVEHRPPNALEQSVWPEKCDGDCVVIETSGRAPTISIGPHDGAWRRTVLDVPLRSGALLLADRPNLASNLVSLTVEDSLAMQFVQAPVVFSALRELFLDVSKLVRGNAPLRRMYDAFPHVRFPAPTRVVLLAVPGVARVTVGHDSVARLGRALGGRKARPELFLAGCVWNPLYPLDTRHLLQLVSDIQVVEVSLNSVPNYCHRCRCSEYWDPHGRDQRWDGTP